MSNKKQTAVDWLYERLERMIPRTALYNIDKKIYFDQAKQMEREQIVDAFKFGEYPPLFVNFNAEQYYNETFGGQDDN